MKVVKIVCGRLCEIRAFDSAGELLEQMNLFEEAVGTYCEGGNYDAARHCAKLIKNPDLNAKLIDYIDRKQRETNKSERNPWNALKLGDYETACEIFKETSDWKNCLDKAQEKGPELLNKYLNAYIKVTVEAGNFAAAAQAYAQYGMPLIPKNYATYKMLTLEIFVECEHKEIEPLRKALFDFYSLLQGTTDAGNPSLIEYNNYLTIAHLANLKFLYEAKPAAQTLHQKITVALLRYCEYIRLDKLFYEAGISCQKNVLPPYSEHLRTGLDPAQPLPGHQRHHRRPRQQQHLGGRRVPADRHSLALQREHAHEEHDQRGREGEDQGLAARGQHEPQVRQQPAPPRLREVLHQDLRRISRLLQVQEPQRGLRAHRLPRQRLQRQAVSQLRQVGPQGRLGHLPQLLRQLPLVQQTPLIHHHHQSI